MEQQPTNPATGVASIEDRVAALFDPQPDNEPQETVPQTEDTPSTETTTEADPQGQPEPVEAKESEPTLPQLEEVEYEGKKHKVAPELKAALMRHADYTQKTQEVAELRKSSETVLQQAKQAFELQQTMLKPLGKLQSLQEQLAPYDRVDWNALMAQDPAAAQQHLNHYTILKDAAQKAEREVQGTYHQAMQAMQKAQAARMEQGVKALQKEIPGWNQDLGIKLLKSRQEAYGFSAEEADIADPRDVREAHDAYQWRQLQAQKATLQKQPPVAKTLKPQASESRTPIQAERDAIRREINSAKTSTEKSKHLERLFALKLK